MAKDPKKAKPIEVSALTHDAATRKNIPTAEYESVMRDEDKAPIKLAYERRIPYDANGKDAGSARATRNRDLDPQLVWRGKDEQDGADLMVQAPPLYIQEKVHPKVIIDDLRRQSAQWRVTGGQETERQPDLFADFNGLKDKEAATEFYQHDQHWSNRMICGDSLSVMASLAEREGLRGKVQCIYIDPPYGIKFNSNFQWSTTSRDVKDGAKDHITREPEQVRAFRDTWRDGIHSYLSYLRDRLTVARDLLSESGSIFVQIGDENVHRVRALMDEVFGEENCVSSIAFSKTSSLGSSFLDSTVDHIIWFAKSCADAKFRRLFWNKELGGSGATQYNFEMLAPGHFIGIEDHSNFRGRAFAHGDMRSQTGSSTTIFPVYFLGSNIIAPNKGGWKTNTNGFKNLILANRILQIGKSLRYIRYYDDHPVYPMTSNWADTGVSGFGNEKLYVVQTLPEVIKRCILMTTDPGDLVLDPTCGSGTTAFVAEQWGRRWITIDTSRVAIALARSRLMGARYPYYLLADSPEGQRKEWEVSGRNPQPSCMDGPPLARRS